MKKLATTILLTISIFHLALGDTIRGKVVDTDHIPILGVSVIGLSPDSVIEASAVTDSLGIFNIVSDRKISELCFRSIGCEPKTLKALPDMGTIVLEEKANLLGEVTVTSKMYQRLVDRDIYRLTMTQMNKYSSFIEALNELPFVRVNYEGILTYKGDNNVQLLLNGVVSNRKEIMGLSKDDISKIEIYDIPPARFQLAGARCAINVITKSDITGGNAAVNISEALWMLKGDNWANLFYNHGPSRWSLEYSDELSHIRKSETDEKLEYEYEDELYGKTKTDSKSKSKYDTHSFTAGYMNRKERNYQFNVQTGYERMDQGSYTDQDVRYYDGTGCVSSTDLKTNYDNLWSNLYFNKTQSNGNEWTVNVAGSIYNTDYWSAYGETLPDGTPYFHSESGYNGRQYYVSENARYSISKKVWSLNAGLFHSYTSHITDTEERKDHLFRHTAHLYIQGYYRIDKMTFTTTLQARYAHSNNRIENESANYSKLAFTPIISINYTPSPYRYLQLSCWRTLINPSVGQLSETDQWLDTRYLFHGNSRLRPAVENYMRLSVANNTNRVTLAAQALWTNASDYIINQFQYTDKGILETVENIRRYNELFSRVDVTVYLTTDGSLYFNTNIEGGRSWGKGNTYAWKGYRFRWMSGMNLNLSRWNFSANYQYPGKRTVGQIITRLPQSLIIGANFRPATNMSVGLQWHQPFGLRCRSVEETVKGAFVHKVTDTGMRDFENLIMARFRYNFNFGKKRDNSQQKLQDRNTDSGIYTK